MNRVGVRYAVDLRVLADHMTLLLSSSYTCLGLTCVLSVIMACVVLILKVILVALLLILCLIGYITL